MKLRHTIFNSIGLAIAGVFGLLFVLNLLTIGHVSNSRAVSYLFDMVLGAIVVVGVGGTALVNLVTDRLQPKMTWVMIAVYFLTCAFSLLGIWGILELLLDSNRRGSRHSETPRTRNNTPTFSLGFTRWAAHISWVSPVASFIVVLACTAFHSKAILHLAVLVLFFVLAVSLALGVAALYSIRDHGKRGILAPALAGTFFNGFLLTLIGLALFAGVQEGLSQGKARHLSVTPNSETNSVSGAK
jgi:TRAP-type C4-dicarboxylate transport system permease small subunit